MSKFLLAFAIIAVCLLAAQAAVANGSPKGSAKGPAKGAAKASAKVSPKKAAVASHAPSSPGAGHPLADDLLDEPCCLLCEDDLAALDDLEGAPGTLPAPTASGKAAKPKNAKKSPTAGKKGKK